MKIILLTLAALAYFGPILTQTPDIVPIPGGLTGDGSTTRYWDCCKVTCAWRGHTNFQEPVKSCTIDGASKIDEETQSGCDVNGSAYSCSDQVGFEINSTLAYGFVAAGFAHTVRDMCCVCLMFSFKGQLSHKKFVVQVTNTGNVGGGSDDDNNHFDIAIPGGGVGVQTLGCFSQWNAPLTGWGLQYGGVDTEEECDELLPPQLQPGCKFRFQFMEGVSNPDVSFEEVECPAELVAISGCKAVS